MTSCPRSHYRRRRRCKRTLRAWSRVQQEFQSTIRWISNKYYHYRAVSCLIIVVSNFILRLTHKYIAVFVTFRLTCKSFLSDLSLSYPSQIVSSSVLDYKLVWVPFSSSCNLCASTLAFTLSPALVGVPAPLTRNLSLPPWSFCRFRHHRP